MGHPYTCLPDVDGFDYLVSIFTDTGMVSQGGMGIAPLTWSEIDAFESCNRLGLSAWENQRIMAMSRAYCKWHSQGGKQKDMPDHVPYIEDTEETRAKMRQTVLTQRDKSHENIEQALQGPA